MYVKRRRILFAIDGDAPSATEGDAAGVPGGGQGDSSGQGGGSGDWRANLPDDIREWDEVKNSDSSDKFWGQVKNMRSFIGQSIRIPSDEAGDDARKEFYNKLLAKVPGLMPKPDPSDNDQIEQVYRALGKPEKPEDYPTAEFKVPTGINLDTAPIDAFKPIAHKHGLSKRQFEGIVKDMTEANIQQAVSTQQNLDQEHQTLKQDWGAAFDQNYNKAVRIAEQTGAPDELLAGLKNNQVRASTAKWLHKLSDAFRAEPNSGPDRNASTVLTPQEAQERITEIYGNKEHPFWVAGHPNHSAALKSMLELQALVNPQASTDFNDLRSGGRG